MVLQTTNGVIWMPTDGYPNGSVSNEIIGKGQAWEMDFARTENDVARIQQILALIKLVNASKPIYMEGAWLDAPGIKLSQQLTPADLAKLNKATWKVKDAGNGEQTAWWCWAMARLRKQVGLPAEPQRPKK
ncbi:hypothetical protein [Hymenobacter defluvii]|uniref:Uncharacterized protein n=1 Tax=Hymenobacter defluvii TaxID=2054411 RepID=A0ABS3TI62_9BACT|nr:hypothetical protein [Hymenobacter defluvii]MBO3273349.1 hypothetical protein [Hymenobacter defluvii]